MKKHMKILTVCLLWATCQCEKKPNVIGKCSNEYTERWIADYFTASSLVKAERNMQVGNFEEKKPMYYTFLPVYSNTPLALTRVFISQYGMGRENEFKEPSPVNQLDENEEYLLAIGIKPGKEFTAYKAPAQYAEYTEKYQDKGKFKYCDLASGPISRAYGLERTEGISVVDKNTGQDLAASTQIYYKFMDIPKREQLLMYESLPTFNARQLNAVPVFILELAESRKGKKIKVCMRLENRQDPLCVVYE
jgi:hypothetical protein